MEFNEILNRRYSCRAFTAQGVEQEKVDRILESHLPHPYPGADAHRDRRTGVSVEAERSC